MGDQFHSDVWETTDGEALLLFTPNCNPFILRSKQQLESHTSYDLSFGRNQQLTLSGETHRVFVPYLAESQHQFPPAVP